MLRSEASELIDFVKRLPPERRNISNKARRKARRRENQRRRRARQSRAAYLAKNNVSREKPWKKQGIDRATWYRRKAKGGAATGVKPEQMMAATSVRPKAQC